MKTDFDKKMVWGESEIGKGGSNDAEPCAKPGCLPFPTCFTTNKSGHVTYGGGGSMWTELQSLED